MGRISRVWPPCSKMFQRVAWFLEMVKFWLQHFWMLQDVARVWPALSNHLTKQSNNAARFCVEMLRVFGQAFTA